MLFNVKHLPPQYRNRPARRGIQQRAIVLGQPSSLKAGTHEGACSRSTLLKHAPKTRSQVSTPTSTHEGHDEGAE